MYVYIYMYNKWSVSYKGRRITCDSHLGSLINLLALNSDGGSYKHYDVCDIFYLRIDS